MAVSNPFALPRIPKREGRLPQLPYPSPLIQTVDAVRRIGTAATVAYALKKGRWRRKPEWNLAVYHAVVWWSSNKVGCMWPSYLLKAVAHGLGVYDRAARRNAASLAAQLEGRYQALRRFPKLRGRLPTSKFLAWRFGVSPATIRQWRRAPDYSARKIATYKVWRRVVNGYIPLGDLPFALRDEFPSEIMKLELNTAKFAAVAPQVGSEERFAIYNLVAAWARRREPLPDVLKSALGVGLGVLEVGKRLDFAGGYG